MNRSMPMIHCLDSRLSISLLLSPGCVSFLLNLCRAFRWRLRAIVMATPVGLPFSSLEASIFSGKNHLHNPTVLWLISATPPSLLFVPFFPSSASYQYHFFLPYVDIDIHVFLWTRGSCAKSYFRSPQAKARQIVTAVRKEEYVCSWHGCVCVCLA